MDIFDLLVLLTITYGVAICFPQNSHILSIAKSIPLHLSYYNRTGFYILVPDDAETLVWDRFAVRQRTMCVSTKPENLSRDVFRNQSNVDLRRLPF